MSHHVLIKMPRVPSVVGCTPPWLSCSLPVTDSSQHYRPYTHSEDSVTRHTLSIATTCTCRRVATVDSENTFNIARNALPILMKAPRVLMSRVTKATMKLDLAIKLSLVQKVGNDRQNHC